MAETITYFTVDNDPNLIRKRGAFWEKYQKGGTWVEVPYYCGIWSGDIPFFEEIAVEEVQRIIEDIERS